MARYKRRSLYRNKRRRYRKAKKRNRGMQRIATVRYPRRNIGGDRARTKLFYVIGHKCPTYGITGPAVSVAMRPWMAFNVGAFHQPSPNGVNSISDAFGSTPNLSTLAQFYMRYRIRGIKLKVTAYYIPRENDPVLCLFVNAAPSQNMTSYPPVPLPPLPRIDILPEQRWSKYRVISNQGGGAKPSSISVYYSVNKVFGPDAITKNDQAFTGQMDINAPYWSTAAGGMTSEDIPNRPNFGPFVTWGIFTMSGDPLPYTEPNVPNPPDVTFKVEATVYTEFFTKRFQIQ